MPLYEYRCEECNNEFELLQRITAEPGGTCPSCSSTRVQRLISLTSFQLKGSGWYVTDYGHNKNPGASNGAKGAPTAEPTPAAKTAADSSPAPSTGTSNSSEGTGGGSSKTEGTAATTAHVA